MKKTSENMTHQKRRKMTSWETQNGPNMVNKWLELLLNIPKTAKKVDFLRDRFFYFLDGQKIEKTRYNILRVSKRGAIAGLLGSLGDYRG